jgi:hypothetical protein
MPARWWLCNWQQGEFMAAGGLHGLRSDSCVLQAYTMPTQHSAQKAFILLLMHTGYCYS